MAQNVEWQNKTCNRRKESQLQKVFTKQNGGTYYRIQKTSNGMKKDMKTMKR